ncbi:MAG TPA: GNAT family N-acetyltransferase [Acidimicrobiales bacterium]|jgi:RimJ/RimL family protein N-acetyltransferase|nr:GNAT family N-acetyltransferase [Acidimicrobiales bacterium]
MEVVRCASPEEFLGETTSYRGLDPIRTNVLGSVASSVANDARIYDAYWWWLVKDNDGVVVGAAMRTAPFGLQIGPMPTEAAAKLAGAVAIVDDEFPWLAGSEELVTTFLESYEHCHSRGSKRTSLRGRMSLLYELEGLVVPEVEGNSRVATMDDFELVDQWSSDFHYFIEGVAREADERDQAVLIARVNEGALNLWSVRGVVVAMAGRATPVETPSGSVTRVGPVFTPAENRGRGYGSAVTASVCEGLLAQGSRVMLYADAGNPTSNGVYQRIGFEIVDNVVQYDLVGA